MVLRALFLVGCVVTVVGCAPLGADSRCILDAGEEDVLANCLPGFSDDGGPLAPPDHDGGSGERPHEAACLALVENVCGTGDPPPCQDAPACAAATLLHAHVPEQCAAALTNAVTYPPCRPGPCSLLVDRVCGGLTDNATCSDAPGCEPARVLYERSSSGDAGERASAEASCNAALEDDVVFAPCN